MLHKNIPNNNKDIIRFLAKNFAGTKKVRNTILFCSIVIGIVAITMVFGISFGKIQAEEIRLIRENGTASSGRIEDGTEEQYAKLKQLDYMPILGDLYDELLRQPEPEAARIAAALELYVSGSLNVFNHRTNVELSNRLVCFDIKQLGKQLKKLGMLIVQDQTWNRVTINRAEKKSTRYYMDEFHLLLKEEQTAAYSVEIWKRFRKWGGIPTAITQNVKDLLASREVENIFENSDFVLMLNQAQGDRTILAKQLNISPQQMKYVTHTEAGEGLIFYGNVVLPFVDRFPKDTELYRVMTTKPEEVSESGK